jgi:hypothetical protein
LHFLALPPEDAAEQEHQQFCVGPSSHFLALPPEDAIRHSGLFSTALRGFHSGKASFFEEASLLLQTSMLCRALACLRKEPMSYE